MKKAICSPFFNKQDFVDMLNINGVEAEITEYGFIFSEKVFTLKKSQMPHWLFMNLDWMREAPEM